MSLLALHWSFHWDSLSICGLARHNYSSSCPQHSRVRRSVLCSHERCGPDIALVHVQDPLTFFTHKLPTSITLHSLSLTIPSVVVRPSALIARGSSVGCNTEATTSLEATASAIASSISSSSSRGRSCSLWCRGGIGAIPRKVAGLTARIAVSASSLSAYSKCWAISLHMSESLAMIALFCCSVVSESISSRTVYYSSLSVVRG